MTTAAKRLAEQALALPEAERMVLLRVLRDSLTAETENSSQVEWDESWKKELDKRLGEMESGEDPGVPLEVIWEDLRKLSGSL